MTSGGSRPAGPPPVEINSSVPHPARVYDYFIGGKDNYAPDRALAEAMIERMPTLPLMTQANREFLVRAVTHVTADLGITQFLDIGSGIPTARNTHQVAQAINPAARVVYVDNDPVVLAHSRALLRSAEEGRTAFIGGDARDPAAILADEAVATTLDLDRPVALLLVSVLMYFDDDEVRRILDTLLAALPPGSALVVSHPTADFDPAASADTVSMAAQSGLTYNNRSLDEVAALFDGLSLVEPGVVPMLEWRLPDAPADVRSVYYYVGVGIV